MKKQYLLRSIMNNLKEVIDYAIDDYDLKCIKKRIRKILKKG